MFSVVYSINKKHISDEFLVSERNHNKDKIGNFSFSKSYTPRQPYFPQNSRTDIQFLPPLSTKSTPLARYHSIKEVTHSPHTFRSILQGCPTVILRGEPEKSNKSSSAVLRPWFVSVDAFEVSGLPVELYGFQKGWKLVTHFGLLIYEGIWWRGWVYEGVYVRLIQTNDY